MNPIRVALVGLSASAKTAWAAEGHLPYLLSARGKANYEIVALLNSSAERAEAARQHYQLPPTVKAYGTPQQVADDPAVDLVVVATRVDVHADAVLPAVQAGKSVYVEWPLAQSLQHAQELRDACADPAASLIGLQGRVAPAITKVRELLAQGTIGTVLSSSVQGYGSILPRDAMPESLAYFTDRSVGGNPSTISFGHMIDGVHSVLGEFRTFDTLLQIERPTLASLNDAGAKTGTLHSDVPDYVALSGPLAQATGAATAPVSDRAPLTVLHRNGRPFPGTPAFTWIVHGERGDVRVAGSTAYVQFDDALGPITIEHHDFASDEVRQVAWDWPNWQKELPVRGRNVAELYERYAAWKAGGRGAPAAALPQHARWPHLDDALQRHRQLDAMFKAWDAARAA